MTYVWIFLILCLSRSLTMKTSYGIYVQKLILHFCTVQMFVSDRELIIVGLFQTYSECLVFLRYSPYNSKMTPPYIY